MPAVIALIVILTATLTACGIILVRNLIQAAYQRGFNAGELQVESAWDNGAQATQDWIDSGRDPRYFPNNPHRATTRI